MNENRKLIFFEGAKFLGGGDLVLSLNTVGTSFYDK